MNGVKKVETHTKKQHVRGADVVVVVVGGGVY